MIDALSVLARYRGNQTGVKYAEAFDVLKMVKRSELIKIQNKKQLMIGGRSYNIILLLLLIMNYQVLLNHVIDQVDV